MTDTANDGRSGATDCYLPLSTRLRRGSNDGHSFSVEACQALAEMADAALKLESQSRPGFRFFGCECGHEWMEPGRDHLSPSGESCPNCDAWCHAAPITMAQYDCLTVGR